jgi:2-polyprenyl-6-methoxyphenol hydroxylase-like FAD-dependent oxidoreductase
MLNVGGIVQTDLATTGRAMRVILGRRGVFGFAVRANGDTWWMSTYTMPLEPAREAPLLPADEIKAELLDRHRGDPPEIREILNAVTTWIGTYPMYELASLPRWQRGRVCLVGDAAHAVGPHVGQGASLALEDALVLAACLRDLESPDAAFTSFEVLRRARVEPVARHSRRTGRWKAPGGPLARRFRDLVLPTLLRISARDAQRLYQWSFDWEADRLSASDSAPSAAPRDLPGPAIQA